MNQRCYFLLGEAPTKEAAARIAEVFSGCPYVYFMGAFGEMVVGIYYLSGEHQWWLQAVAENPQATLGLKRAALYVTDRPAFPAGMEPRLPRLPPLLGLFLDGRGQIWGSIVAMGISAPRSCSRRPDTSR